MGTPLKLTLLSPKVLSPISPGFLSVPNKKDVIFSTPKIRRTIECGKRLNFSTSPVTTNVAKNSVKISFAEQYEPSQIKRRDVLINTPAKRIISASGLEDQKSLNILGRGGFGKVVRAVHKGQVVALKVLKNTATSQREKNALHLDHNNVVKVIDVVSNEMGIYTMVIMEYYPESRQLQNILEDPGVEIKDKIISFAIDIARGLNYCHVKGILHLDIKPQNIMVCGSTCKLCDFGNSIQTASLGDTFEHNGTISYTSPEILLGKFPTDKSDIYSYGVVLWQMKTRSNPFQELDNLHEIIYKVVKCGLRPDMELPDDKYKKLYQSCWDYEPSMRPSSSQCINTLLQLK